MNAGDVIKKPNNSKNISIWKVIRNKKGQPSLVNAIFLFEKLHCIFYWKKRVAKQALLINKINDMRFLIRFYIHWWFFVSSFVDLFNGICVDLRHHMSFDLKCRA